MYELRKVFGETRLHPDGTFGDIINPQDGSGGVKSVRSLTMVIILNSDFEGGIYNFPNQNIQIKPVKGTALLFPPYYTHIHSVSMVESGKFRYICSSWAIDEFLINEQKNKQNVWSYKNFKM